MRTRYTYQLWLGYADKPLIVFGQLSKADLFVVPIETLGEIENFSVATKRITLLTSSVKLRLIDADEVYAYFVKDTDDGAFIALTYHLGKAWRKSHLYHAMESLLTWLVSHIPLLKHG